ncbi:hypothetical protein GCM10011487_12070 [Steroidobacter agaridevorans]|uniref:Uncharacterized protein n=1 Tax=Steroidobacter agaridevorans TaxID=2695856 RepID=A0A829Y7J0_9GAMM|nr:MULTISPECIES: hypothetical protein [Steroidobacteraceae]GFE79207.1 hypothetical protein GCM10011487_12070 [Steroidobacter agaridevorans]
MSNAWTVPPSILRAAPRREEELYLVPYEEGSGLPHVVVPGVLPEAFHSVDAIADGKPDASGRHYLKYAAKAVAKSNQQVLDFLLEKRQYIYAETQKLTKLYIEKGGMNPQVAQAIIDGKKAIQQTVGRDFRMFPSSRIAVVNGAAALRLGLIERSPVTQGAPLERVTKAALRTPVGAPHLISPAKLARAQAYIKGVKYFGVSVDLAPEVATLLTSTSAEDQERALRNGAKVVAKEVGTTLIKPVVSTALRTGALWAARGVSTLAAQTCLVAFLAFTPSGLVLIGLSVAFAIAGEFLLGSMVQKGTDWLVDMTANAIVELRRD